jgi:hypothetical protein
VGRMSELDLDRQLLDAVSSAMQQPVLSSEEQMERRIDSIIRDLDEVVAFAANPETVDLVEVHRIGVGQIISRANLVARFLMTREPLRIVHNA